MILKISLNSYTYDYKTAISKQYSYPLDHFITRLFIIITLQNQQANFCLDILIEDTNPLEIIINVTVSTKTLHMHVGAFYLVPCK